MIHGLVNGTPSENIPLRDRGFLYGDGVFETIRVIDHKPVLLDDHLQRLYTGMERLGILADFGIDVLISEVESMIKLYAFKDAVIKVIITRGQSERGYSPAGSGPPWRIVQIETAPGFNKNNTHCREGIRAKVLSTRLGLNPDLAGIKHLNRLEQVLAASELEDQFTEGVMLDTNGLVREGIRSNIFFVEDHRLLTPELEFSGVHGVMRAYLLNQGASMGLQCDLVNDCKPARLLEAEELFFCNSVYGVWPVRELVDGNEMKHYQSWMLTRRVQELINLELRIPQQ